MVDGTNGRPDLSKQEMNMNTAYENETRELTFEEMEKISGGETLNEFIQGEIILIKCILATGGLHPATGPLT
jgi:hypothetical protein